MKQANVCDISCTWYKTTKIYKCTFLSSPKFKASMLTLSAQLLPLIHCKNIHRYVADLRINTNSFMCIIMRVLNIESHPICTIFSLPSWSIARHSRFFNYLYGLIAMNEFGETGLRNLLITYASNPTETDVMQKAAWKVKIKIPLI